MKTVASKSFLLLCLSQVRVYFAKGLRTYLQAIRNTPLGLQTSGTRIYTCSECCLGTRSCANTQRLPGAGLGLPHLLLQVLTRKKLAESKGQCQQRLNEDRVEEVHFTCHDVFLCELAVGNVPAHPGMAGGGRTCMVQHSTEVLDGRCAPSC